MTQEKDINDKNDFMTAFTGKFFGILRWHQLDDLWTKLKADNTAWYVYPVGGEVPTEITQGDDLNTFIDEIDVLLRREHDEDYCGIVYANDTETPSFVKIFDPNNIGTSCSIATKGPLPGWILSKIPPVNLAEAMQPTANRRKWWQKIFK